MGGSTKNSVWVSLAYVIGEVNETNDIEMSHYVNTARHQHTIYSTIKYVLVDTWSSGTYIRPDCLHENAHNFCFV